jgi:hypothetical protein
MESRRLYNSRYKKYTTIPNVFLFLMAEVPMRQ